MRQEESPIFLKMHDLEAEILKKKQEQITQLLRGITSYNDISIPDIVLYLGFKEEQYSSFNKCAQGKLFPKFLNSQIDLVLEKLEQVAKNPELIYEFRESLTEEGSRSYRRAPRSTLVWIPFDIQLPVSDFNGSKQPISFIQVEKQMGIVAYRNTSRYNADGEVYVHQIGMATDIEPGMRIAIKRINKLDWQTDRYYLIIDASQQMNIRALHPGDDKKTIKYISTSSSDGPYIELPLDRIVAMFSIVDGNLIPMPKRDNNTAPTSQQ
jgi:hypothetical protein